MNSLLKTDAYKFSMAEAGFPLRTETFYYSHRKGGWQYLPVDVKALVKASLPTPSDIAYEFLSKHGYTMGGAYKKAVSLLDQVVVTTMPKGSWFYEREPVFSVTGPSALVSWLEPTILQLNYQIQVATCALLDKKRLAEKVYSVTCAEERDLIVETLTGLSVSIPEINVCTAQYITSVMERSTELIREVKDPDRLFEVGMRAVSCFTQHLLALEALRKAGIRRSTNVEISNMLDLVPVGTMGHEHIQRYGSDLSAFRAMRDRFPGFVFYLPDTFDTLLSGIPSALTVMKENPTRESGIRFDSEHGITGHYLYAVNRAKEMGLSPMLGLESGWNLKLTQQFESLREQVGWPADKQCYGLGGYLVRPPWPHFGRDDVSAVWKISQSGGSPTMKFGDEPNGGKSSIPGRPVVWRAFLGRADYHGPAGCVAQEGEMLDSFYGVLFSGMERDWKFTSNEIKDVALRQKGSAVVLSPMTQALIKQCTRERSSNISSLFKV